MALSSVAVLVPLERPIREPTRPAPPFGFKPWLRAATESGRRSKTCPLRWTRGSRSSPLTVHSRTSAGSGGFDSAEQPGPSPPAKPDNSTKPSNFEECEPVWTEHSSFEKIAGLGGSTSIPSTASARDSSVKPALVRPSVEDPSPTRETDTPLRTQIQDVELTTLILLTSCWPLCNNTGSPLRAQPYGGTAGGRTRESRLVLEAVVVECGC